LTRSYQKVRHPWPLLEHKFTNIINERKHGFLNGEIYS